MFEVSPVGFSLLCHYFDSKSSSSCYDIFLECCADSMLSICIYWLVFIDDTGWSLNVLSSWSMAWFGSTLDLLYNGEILILTSDFVFVVKLMPSTDFSTATGEISTSLWDCLTCYLLTYLSGLRNNCIIFLYTFSSLLPSQSKYDSFYDLPFTGSF